MLHCSAQQRMIVALAALMLASCKETQKGTVIASVGNVELTREQAIEYIDTSNNNSEIALMAYIDSWINSELINQEAQRTKIDQSEEVYHRLSDTKKQLVNQMFLDRFINNDTSAINEQALRDYYAQHQSEFLAHEVMVKLQVAIFNSRERASVFATKFTKSSSWDAAIADTGIALALVSAPPSQYYSQHTLYPPELWKIATALTLKDISFPVRIPSGYAIVQLVDIAREGAPSPFELVRDEVHTRMLIEHRRKRYAELLGNLRKQYTVKVFTETTHSPDTTQPEHHE
jgi:parvulin-like peptidyl-prolyl isomerase